MLFCLPSYADSPIGIKQRGQSVTCGAIKLKVKSLLLVVRPGAPSSFLFLVAMPGAPSSVLAPSSDARTPQAKFNLEIVNPSELALNTVVKTR